jgi:hypothetical protein
MGSRFILDDAFDPRLSLEAAYHIIDHLVKDGRLSQTAAAYIKLGLRRERNL